MKSKPDEILAKNLKFLRKQKGMTQEELAEHFNVQRSVIGSWETLRNHPDIAKIVLMSDFFGVTLDDLMRKDIEKTGPQKDNEKSKKNPKLSNHNFLSNFNEDLFDFALLVLKADENKESFYENAESIVLKSWEKVLTGSPELIEDVDAVEILLKSHIQISARKLLKGEKK